MSAVISACGQYRYQLWRDLAPTGVLFLFSGINPSTAEAEIEDQTTMKWRGFTLRNGGRGYGAVNPFGYRTTNVKRLASVTDPVGPDNAANIDAAIARADVLVPCWGNRSKVPKSLRHHLDTMQRRMFASGKPVRVFGFTKSGDPMHPLMLGYATPLIDWRSP